MQSSDWVSLLESVPAALRCMRGSARPDQLVLVEKRLDRELPAAFKSLLLVADGGWIGDHQIYGSPELLELTGRPCGPMIGGQGPPAALLPFHPVDRRGVECLDLDRPGAPVVWCRVTEGLGPADLMDPVHPLARRLRAWGGGQLPEIDDTYIDFLDWALDVLEALHQRQPWPMAAVAARG